MKNIIHLFCAGVLLSGLCAGFVGCDNANGPEQSENEMLPVSVSELPDDVTAFFGKYLPTVSGSANSECFFVNNKGNECLMINNIEELKAIMSSSIEPPAIDFDQYTLIVGQHQTASISYYYLGQSLDIESTLITINLIIKVTESAWGALGKVYYWGLYPKLPKIAIKVNAICEK